MFIPDVFGISPLVALLHARTSLVAQTPAGVESLIDSRVTILDAMHTCKGARDLYILSALTKDGGRQPAAGFWVARNRIPYIKAALKEICAHLNIQAGRVGKHFKVEVVILDDDSKGSSCGS
jgi:hypothetical protein